MKITKLIQNDPGPSAIYKKYVYFLRLDSWELLDIHLPSSKYVIIIRLQFFM